MTARNIFSSQDVEDRAKIQVSSKSESLLKFQILVWKFFFRNLSLLFQIFFSILDSISALEKSNDRVWKFL